MATEENKTEQNVTMEVVRPEDLPRLLDDTLNETVLQHVSVVLSGSELLKLNLPNSSEQALTSVQSSARKAFDQLRSLQRILRQDPTQPIPLDHKYESGGGKPIIALDHIPQPPK